MCLTYAIVAFYKKVNHSLALCRVTQNVEVKLTTRATSSAVVSRAVKLLQRTYLTKGAGAFFSEDDALVFGVLVGTRATHVKCV